MKENILIIEDEEAIGVMLDYALLKAGFRCQIATSIERAKPIIAKSPPDLILLDWMLPGMSGIDYARILRQSAKTRTIPIIMLTAKGAESDKIKGLETGADDYITKPFSIKELVARVKALLRRYATDDPQTHSQITEIKGLALDANAYRVTIHGQVLEMSPTEFKLLHFFIKHPERVYSRAQLLDHVWGNHVYVEDRTVDVHILRLRKVLEPFAFDRFIQTVRGVGYRFSTH